MAIIKNIELENGIVISYIRIKAMQKSLDVDRGAEMIITVEYYLDDIARQSKEYVTLDHVNIPVVNSFEEAYIELKKLPKYVGAINHP